MTTAATNRDSGDGLRPICPCRRIAASPRRSPAGDAATADPVPSSPAVAGRARESQVTQRTRSAAVWALPSVALALVPKCPMCVAAYLAIGGGLGVSLTTAAHLRTALVWLCWSTLALLAVRMVARVWTRHRSIAMAPSVRRDARPSPARTAAA